MLVTGCGGGRWDLGTACRHCPLLLPDLVGYSVFAHKQSLIKIILQEAQRLCKD